MEEKLSRKKEEDANKKIKVDEQMKENQRVEIERKKI
jgi:hypothetical protein